MRKTLLTLALLSINIGSAHAFLDSVTDKASESGLMDMVGKSLGMESSPLTDALTSTLPISTEQAAGGSSALLAMAQSQLSEENSNELESLIPGLSNLGDIEGLFGSVDSLSGVQDAFDKLGIDPSMIGQFADVKITSASDFSLEGELLKVAADY